MLWKKLGVVIGVMVFWAGTVATAQEDKINHYIYQLQLQKDDWKLRQEAVKALGESGDPRAVEPLIMALKDTNENVRQGAAEALGKIGDPRAIEPLIVALKDENSGMARLAITEALGKIGNPRAVKPLLVALKDKNWRMIRFRVAIIEALAKIGEPAVESLIAALKDTDETVRQGAVQAIEELLDIGLLTACQGQPLDSTAFAISQTHRARILSLNPDVGIALPEDITATMPGELYYAICLTERVESGSACSYGLGHKLIPQQVIWNIDIRDIRTGKSVNSTEIGGGMPSCPSEASFYVGEISRGLPGAKPATSKVLDWIKTVLEKQNKKKGK